MKNPRKEFSKIYDNCIEKIYRFIYFKVNSEEIAQDLCSETFLKGWEVFKVNHHNIENPQAFLYKIARNLVTDYYRVKGRTRFISVEKTSIVDPGQSLEEMALLNSDIDNIRKVLTDLKEDYQNVIIWHYLDDLSISEIAKMMEKSEPATRVTLHRALKSLKNKIKEV